MSYTMSRTSAFQKLFQKPPHIGKIILHQHKKLTISQGKHLCCVEGLGHAKEVVV